MVREADRAHHVAQHNRYTVGVEHEGFESNPDWYSAAMFNSSSLLRRDIADSNGIDPYGTCDASLGWDTELDRYSGWTKTWND